MRRYYRLNDTIIIGETNHPESSSCLVDVELDKLQGMMLPVDYSQTYHYEYFGEFNPSLNLGTLNFYIGEIDENPENFSPEKSEFKPLLEVRHFLPQKLIITSPQKLESKLVEESILNYENGKKWVNEKDCHTVKFYSQIPDLRKKIEEYQNLIDGLKTQISDAPIKITKNIFENGNFDSL